MNQPTPQELSDQYAKAVSLLADSLHVLALGDDQQAWPLYFVDGSPRPRPVPHSISTMAMIGFSLASLAGDLPGDELSPNPLSWKNLDLKPQLTDQLSKTFDKFVQYVGKKLAKQSNREATEDNALQNLRDELSRLIAKTEQLEGRQAQRVLRELEAARDAAINNDSSITVSSLFGIDDPFTLDWLTRLSHWNRLEATDQSPLREACAKIIDRIRNDGPEKFQLMASTDLNDPRNQLFVPSVWPLVRVAYLARAFNSPTPPQESPANMSDILTDVRELLADYLESCVIRQLGFAGIEDASFDVAVLIIALDGLTLLKPAALHEGLLKKFTAVVLATLDAGSNLQPRHPFRLTLTGGVHIPVDIEVLLALLRVVRRAEPQGTGHGFFASLYPVFKRYLQRLQASRVSVYCLNDGENTKTEYRGWASNHEYAVTNRVETWYSSQVLLYLALYASLLEDQRAKLSLKKHNLPLDRPPSINETIAQVPQVAAVLDRFPRQGTRDTHSILLYGPPGTGKTTIARQIAAKLGWDFLAISPSNFVASGADRVEESATALFEVLRHQHQVVILFDEIDRLILDRNSEEYGKQSDIFQFMTPSMLTKLQDLRERERAVFCISTNYAWRIDPAIIRPGRIDHRHLILPPGFAARKAFLGDHIPPELNPDVWAKETTLASYAELRGLAAELKAKHQLHYKNPRVFLQQAEETQKRFRPTISFSTYLEELDRLDPSKTSNYLLEEALKLALLLAECERPVGQQKKDSNILLKALKNAPIGIISNKEIAELRVWASKY